MSLRALMRENLQRELLFDEFGQRATLNFQFSSPEGAPRLVDPLRGGALFISLHSALSPFSARENHKS